MLRPVSSSSTSVSKEKGKLLVEPTKLAAMFIRECVGLVSNTAALARGAQRTLARRGDFACGVTNVNIERSRWELR